MKNRVLRLLLAACVLFGILPLCSFAESAPYEIDSAADLLAFETLVEGGEQDRNAILTAGFDMTGIAWDGIASYSGTFDGQGYTIQNLTGTQGLFGDNYGTVKNVRLENVAISASDGGRGAVVAYNKGTVSCCVSSGTVSGNGYSVGGIVGWNDGGTVSGCVSFCTVTGWTAGGLVGSNYHSGKLNTCYYGGSMTAMEGDNPWGTALYVYYYNGGNYTAYRGDSSATADSIITVYNSWSNSNSGAFRLAQEGNALVVVGRDTPVAADFVFTAPAELTYDAAAKQASVVPATGVTGMGEITVKYYKNGVQTQPVDAGTYQVKIDVAASSKHAAATDLTDAGWTFTVAPKGIWANWGALNFVPYTGNNILPTPVATGLLGSDTCTLTARWVETDPGAGVIPGTWTATLDTVSNPNYSILNHTVTASIINGSQSAPVLSGIDESFRGKNDGAISGLTVEMEYSTDGTQYTRVTDPLMSFAPGTYYVRYCAKQYYNASPTATVTIGEGIVDVTAPTLEGIEDGKTYYGDLTVIKPDDQFFDIKLVTLDGEPMGFLEGTYGLIPADNGQHTVVVEDHAGNKTTYRVWVMKQYTVTFMADGKVYATQTVGHGMAAAIPQPPEKKGYTVAWDKEPGIITENVTVTAVYTPIADIPQTGDPTELGILLLVMLLSGAALSALVVGKQKKLF